MKKVIVTKSLGRKIHRVILGWGLFLSALLVGLMAYTFMRAYFNPNKQILLTIDRVGEANVEFVLLFLIVPTVAYTATYYILKMVAEMKAERNLKAME